jgi:hypothetical protein
MAKVVYLTDEQKSRIANLIDTMQSKLSLFLQVSLVILGLVFAMMIYMWFIQATDFAANPYRIPFK